MQIVLLGSGGYHPNNHRHTACLMIPEVGVVLDAGTGAFRLQQRLVTDHLDIFLSHGHLDHVFGLTCLIGLFNGEDSECITVHAETSKIVAIREHLFSELLFPVDPPCRFVELQEKESLPEGGTLTWFPLKHPGGSVGYRLEWPGHSMAYVTDTVAFPQADYVEKIAGVDLLIHEAYFDDSHRDLAQLTGHCCVTDVAKVAASAGVKRLVLVHMNPRQDLAKPLDLTQASRYFSNLEFGCDEMTIDF